MAESIANNSPIPGQYVLNRGFNLLSLVMHIGLERDNYSEFNLSGVVQLVKCLVAY